MHKLDEVTGQSGSLMNVTGVRYYGKRQAEIERKRAGERTRKEEGKRERERERERGGLVADQNNESI